LIARWPARGAAWASSSVMAMAMAGASSASAVAALRRPVGQDVSHGGRGRHGDREQRRQSYRDRWQSCWTPEKRALPPAPRSGRVTPAPRGDHHWPTGASEGPGGGRVRVRRDRYGTRRCGAPAPVVSAHARACELRHSLTAPNEPCVEVRTRSSAPTPDAVTHLWGHLNPGSFRGACRTREPPGALPAFHACTFHACRSGRRA
jgi:hypothetical protein